MRYGAAWAVAGSLFVVVGTGGCGIFGGNKSEVCADSKQAVEQYMTQIRAAPADDAAQWKAATSKLAARFDTLAAESDDAKVRQALKSQAAALNAAAATVGTGDTVALNQTLTSTPKTIGTACA